MRYEAMSRFNEYARKANAYAKAVFEEYAEAAAYILTHTRPEVVIHRLTGDCPRDMLIAPEWNRDKHAVIEKIVSLMEKRGLSQGSSL